MEHPLGYGPGAGAVHTEVTTPAVHSSRETLSLGLKYRYDGETYTPWKVKKNDRMENDVSGRQRS